MTAHIRYLALREHMSHFICYRTMGENSGEGRSGKRNRSEKVGKRESGTGRVIRAFN